MQAIRRLTRLVSGSRARLLAAERRFFDAYNRGGTHWREPLVIPLDYFARRDVSAALHAWRSGTAPLDLDSLERAWCKGGGRGDREPFLRNLAHFISLAA